MGFKLKSVIRFLFPECQIIEAIKEEGFIEKNNSLKSTQTVKENSRVQQTASGSTTNQNQARSSNQRESLKNATVYTSTSFEKLQIFNLDDKFRDINFEMNNVLIGQKEYSSNLTAAFKRPYIAGYDNIKPKNTIFICGKRSSGKMLGVITMAALLKAKKIIKYDYISTLDLARYSNNTQYDIFISDVYKALYENSDILAFENYEKCHSSMIDILSSLVQKGTYVMDKRYTMTANGLVEATGSLVQNSISEISANGKFFVFISEKKESSIVDIFGSKFMSHISDIITLAEFSKDDLTRIAFKFTKELSERSLNTLQISIDFDDRALKNIVNAFDVNTGIAGMIEYIQTEIYKPLTEYKLRNSFDTKNVMITLEDTKYKCICKNTAFFLSDILPKRDNSGLEEAKKELDKIIGLSKVKEYILSLEDNLEVQKMRRNAGFKAVDISMHMIFTGNPGTGKTTIARVVAKYLKALGVLSSGQLREVTRNDLVGQYVGHTAKITNDVIKSALGGVLFIDEAYSLCRNDHDTFGLEAIDTLVKAMEDNRDNLVVILAGYSDEMKDFLKTNSGLKSRFPNIINFDDYTAQEMYDISVITAKSKGYIISSDCKDALLKLYNKKQIKGRNDSGNGRLVRNVIEEAILRQSKRLLKEKDVQMDLLVYDDFQFEDTSAFDLEKQLAKIVGLENVKDFVRTQYKLLIAQEKRRKAGMVVDTTQSLNMIFIGNPGTGKTTVARIVASMFKEMGFLKSGHLVEVDRGDLVAQYAGQTAKKTEEVFKSALGGVLFIDEAYALSSDGNSYGKESIDTLVKLIEDHRGEIVVILAGYKKEMKDFLKSNSGLQSRFPLNIEFPDYSVNELEKIALMMIKSKGFVLDSGCDKLLKEQIETLHRHSNAHSGNGRMIRNYLDEIIRNQSARIAMEDVDDKEMNVIVATDIVSKTDNLEYNLEHDLAKIVGLEEVKNYIRGLNAKLRLQNERKKMGLQVDNTQTLHMIFKGNPGTGKTMMARTIANVLYNMRIIKTNKLIETDRAGLVAGYVGQTAIKIKEVILDALDGVLFIDEAYSLSQGGANDYGKEAIDMLVKMMDDHRDRLVVILAGYSSDMDNLLKLNAGIKSRFPNIIEFSDYSIEELMKLSQIFYQTKGYILEEKALIKLEKILLEAKKETLFGNGRYVRNIFEKSINKQALRLSTDNDLTKEELITIIDLDIERV